GRGRGSRARSGGVAVRRVLGFGPVFAPGGRWLAIACAVALAAGLARLGHPGLWIEEIYTARWAALPWPALVTTLRGQLHPPLYFVLERLLAPTLGGSEAGLRLLALLSGVAAVAAAFWAVRPILNDRVSAAAAWFLALSPQFFLYARMAQYFALAALAAMVAHGLFVRLAMERGRPRSWALYALAAALMLYTSYLSLCLVLAHGVWAAVSRRRRELLPGWIAATAASLLLLSPWLVALSRAAAPRPVLVPPLVAKPAQAVLLLGLDLHALTATELLFPWEPLGAVGVVCGAWLLGTGALAAVRRGLGRSVLLPAAAALALSWAVVSSIATTTPFVGIPARTLFLWPFGATLMALGALDSAQRRPLRWAATAGVVLAWLMGWVHLYRGEHYMNPIYLTPGREVAADVARQARAGDVVLSETDSGVNYYLERLHTPFPVLDPVSPDSVRVLLAAPSTRRAWWVRLSRDGSQRARPAEATEGLLGAWGSLESTRGYLEIDPRYQAVKRAALGVVPYQYRIVLQRWSRKD
ncbi:MAG TPA: glycosyltransferase family 39 protein, partial [Candidatus Eisenbacteria bacterium]